MAARPGPDRIEAGGLLAGLGAILLLIALFLDWFEPGLTAWATFEALDLVLAGAALVALAFAARSFGLTSIGETAVIAASVVAFTVVASQLIDHPPAAIGRDVAAGAWLGLAGACLMVLGAFMSRLGISLAVNPARPTAARGPAAGPQTGTAAGPSLGGRETPVPPASGAARHPEDTTPLPPEDRRA